MSSLDWTVMCLTIIAVVGYGIWQTKGSKDLNAYLLGGNEAKWWTVGLSVMATQASAITFLSTPGQAYYDGMGFIQFYFALPIALIIICVTFIPLYYRLKVYTAYEFLEQRFDYKTRALTSFLFLIQRGLATGIVLYAPAIVLSSIMGWSLDLTVIFIGCVAILYTVMGGTKAVHVTHRLQMIVILSGLVIIGIILINTLTVKFDFTDILTMAGASDKLDLIDTSFNVKERYNIWSCLIAAPFLFLSYFGTDQSQVQRYISGRSVADSRMGLILNAFFKLPLQFFILFLGILVFVFYQFNKAPIFFNSKVIDKIEQTGQQDESQELRAAYSKNFESKQIAQEAYLSDFKSGDQKGAKLHQSTLSSLLSNEREIREKYKKLIATYDPSINTNDKDYVFINYIISYLPKGLIGLLFAMIFFAAMSTSASELNALASTSTVDIYKRLIVRDATDGHYVFASKMLTLFWGVFAILFASFGTLFENLIQFVNIIGSIFYGTILGIFLVAFYFKKIGGSSVFYAAVVTELIIVSIYFSDVVGFLWLNLIGALGVILIAHLIGLMSPKSHSA